MDKPSSVAPEASGLLSFIGNTPLVRIRTLNPNPNVEIWAKLERNNPGGSIKDRVALWMVQEAERTGELRPGKTIIEYRTSPCQRPGGPAA